MEISAVIITKNEENNIENCIQCLKFCDEIIVVDDFSNDKTVEISKKLNAIVYQRKLSNDFSAQRNFGLKKAGSDWVLFIDADERAGKELAVEMQNAIKQPDIAGYYLKRQDIFLGKKINFGETSQSKHLRLIRKNSGQWKRSVHEIFKINGKTRILDYSLLHYPHPTISEFIKEINQYTEIVANYRIKHCTKPSLVEILVYPLAKFLNNYLFRFGFLDGFSGLVIAYVMSLHSLLVRVKHKTNQ